MIRELQSALTAKDFGHRQTQHISNTRSNASNHFAVSAGKTSYSEDLATNGSAHARFSGTDFRRVPESQNRHGNSQSVIRSDLTATEEDQYHTGTHIDLDSPTLSRDLNGMNATTTNVLPDLSSQSQFSIINPTVVSSSAALGDVESWESMYGGLDAMSNYGNQHFDIFQLMDPSYLVSGQMTSS